MLNKNNYIRNRVIGYRSHNVERGMLMLPKTQDASLPVRLTTVATVWRGASLGVLQQEARYFISGQLAQEYMDALVQHYDRSPNVIPLGVTTAIPSGMSFAEFTEWYEKQFQIRS